MATKKKSKMKFSNPRFNYVKLLHDSRANPTEFAKKIGESTATFSQKMNRGTATYAFIRKLEDILKKDLSEYIII